MALSAARASLRDEAPRTGGPRRMLDVVRVGVLHTTRNSCIGESPVILKRIPAARVILRATG